MAASTTSFMVQTDPATLMVIWLVPFLVLIAGILFISMYDSHNTKQIEHKVEKQMAQFKIGNDERISQMKTANENNVSNFNAEINRLSVKIDALSKENERLRIDVAHGTTRCEHLMHQNHSQSKDYFQQCIEIKNMSVLLADLRESNLKLTIGRKTDLITIARLQKDFDELTCKYNDLVRRQDEASRNVSHFSRLEKVTSSSSFRINNVSPSPTTPSAIVNDTDLYETNTAESGTFTPEK